MEPDTTNSVDQDPASVEKELDPEFRVGEGLVKLDLPTLTAEETAELQKVHAKFEDFDPLQDDGMIHVLVLDRVGAENRSDHSEIVAGYVGKDLPENVIIETLDSGSINSYLDKLDSGEIQPPEALNISLSPSEDTIFTIEDLNKVMGNSSEAGTLVTEENFLEHAGRIREFLSDPENAEKLLNGYDIGKLNDKITSFESLAERVEGPVTIAAGNDGEGTFNPFSLILADDPEHSERIVVVKASEAGTNEYTNYSTRVGHVSHPVDAEELSVKVGERDVKIEYPSGASTVAQELNSEIADGAVSKPLENLSEDSIAKFDDPGEFIDAVALVSQQDETTDYVLANKYLSAESLDEVLGYLEENPALISEEQLQQLRNMSEALPEDEAVLISNIRYNLNYAEPRNVENFAIDFRGYEGRDLALISGTAADFEKLTQGGASVDQTRKLYDNSFFSTLADQSDIDPEVKKIFEDSAGSDPFYVTGEILSRFAEIKTADELDDLLVELSKRPSGTEIYIDDGMGLADYRGGGSLIHTDKSEGTSLAAPSVLNSILKEKLESENGS